MSYPQRHPTHQLEEISIRYFTNCLPPNWHSEKPTADYGVDLKVDIFDGTEATGLELLVQLKASAESQERAFETIQLKTTTYNHLWDKLQVAMLVKYVEAEKEAYWILLSSTKDPKPGTKTTTIRIPKKNRLSSIDWEAIRSYIREVTDGKISTRRKNRFNEA